HPFKTPLHKQSVDDFFAQATEIAEKVAFEFINTYIPHSDENATHQQTKIGVFRDTYINALLQQTLMESVFRNATYKTQHDLLVASPHLSLDEYRDRWNTMLDAKTHELSKQK